MRIILFTVVSLALFVVVTVQAAFAQQAPTQPAVQKIVDEICSDGGAWLTCYSLEPSRCQEVTVGFVEPCVKSLMATPVAEPAAKGVVRLLACFNQRFMAKYGQGEVKTPECKDPMKHLSHAG
jgi:hypothetical protein